MQQGKITTVCIKQSDNYSMLIRFMGLAFGSLASLQKHFQQFRHSVLSLVLVTTLLAGFFVKFMSCQQILWFVASFV